MTSALDRVTACLTRLPGVGRRSAERMALRLLTDRQGLLSDLIAALQKAVLETAFCSQCGGLTSKGREPCQLCTDPDRDAGLLCVVEEPGDITLVERCGAYQGRYHVLQGRLSPARGIGPEQLRSGELLRRVERDPPREVILALSTDVEGEATAHWLREQLEGRGVKVTRLAFGLPAGSGLAYSDPLTLARALRGRTAMETGP